MWKNDSREWLHISQAVLINTPKRCSDRPMRLASPIAKLLPDTYIIPDSPERMIHGRRSCNISIFGSYLSLVCVVRSSQSETNLTSNKAGSDRYLL